MNDNDMNMETESISNQPNGPSAAEFMQQGANNRRNEIENIMGRRNDNEEYDTTSRRTRQRVGVDLIPLDLNLINSQMMRRTQPILLSDLLNKDVTQIRRNGRIDLMLIRCIANGKHGQTNYMVKQYSSRGGSKANCSNSNYSRLFLFKVMNETGGNGLVYMMEAENQNKKLWGRNPTLRDDGTIAIGTIIRIMNPMPIESIMPDGIPSLITRFPGVVLRQASIIPQVPINDGLAGNNSLAFALNNCQIQILSSTPEETGCAGRFCDKQRIHEIAQYRQGCACYVWSDRRNNMVIDHSMQISHELWSVYISNFSSLRFSSLYQTGVFSTSIRRDMLELSEQYYELEDKIENVIDLINNNGGFTIVGWYKRGIINDRSVLTAINNNENGYKQNNTNNPEVQVDNGKLNYHPCSIQPTNRRFFDENDHLHSELKSMKFDVSTLHQMN
jgi:hypothetical protein